MVEPGHFARTFRRDVPAPLNVLIAISISNWLAHFLVTGVLGGSALGTSPINPNEFFVGHSSHRTIVSPHIWLFSLVYTTITVLLPIATIWALTLYAFLGDHPLDRKIYVLDARLNRPGLVLVSLFCLVCFYSVVRDFVTSSVAWAALR